MKLVAVSQRVDLHPVRHERRDALDQALHRFLLTADLLPVPVPNGLISGDALKDDATCALAQWLQTVQPMAIVLSGGNNIGDCIDRDNTERFLLDYADRLGLPVLGICRGMQMMCTWAGATLRPIKNHVDCRHDIYGSISGEVNSYHGFSVDDLPENIQVLARSADHTIEAVCFNASPWEGWMWHPERETPFNPRDIQRLRDVLRASW
jgi:putative glutamine amidotransferase